MRMIQGWAGPRFALAALALGVLLAPVAQAAPTESLDPNDLSTLMDKQVPASPLVSYSTVAAITVDEDSVVGNNVIGFNSILSQNFVSPSTISLGEFQVIPGLEDSVSTTYNNAKFTITLGFEQINGAIPEVNETPVEIQGFLNGTITGTKSSNVTATFDLDPENPISFQVGDFMHSLVKMDPVDLAPSSLNSGRTTIQGRLESTTGEVQIPEPTSIAVFLTALVGGLGLRRRALAKRA